MKKMDTIKFVFSFMMLHFAISANSNILVEDKGISLRQDESDLKMCSYQITQRYFLNGENKSSYKASFPDAITAKLCPSITQTCCDSFALFENYMNFEKAYMNLRQYFVTLQIIIKALEGQNFQKPITLNEAKEIGKVEYNIIDDFENKKRMEMYLLFEFTTEMKLVYEKSSAIIYTVSSYYSGLICGTCRPEIGVQFSEIKGDNFEDKKTRISFRQSVESFRTYLKMVREVAYFQISINKVYKIFKSVLKINKMITDIDFNSDEEIGIFIKNIDELIDLTLSGDMSWKKLANDEVLSLSSLNLEQSYHIRDDIKTFYEQIGEFMLKKFEHRIFLAPIYLESDLIFYNIINNVAEWNNLENFDFIYDFDEDGFSMTEHKYNEKLWFLSLKSFGLYLGILFASILIV